MDKTNQLTTFEAQLSKVLQELSKQRTLIETLTKRVKVLEERLPHLVTFGDNSSHSTASNREFMCMEVEKNRSINNLQLRSFRGLLKHFQRREPQILYPKPDRI